MTSTLSLPKSIMRIIAVVGLALGVGFPGIAAAGDGTALEVVAFTLNDPSDIDKLREADKMTAEWVATQPGFISRETGAGANGDWIVIVHWATLADAEAAGVAFMQLSQAQGEGAMSMFDPSTMLFKHYVVE